MLDRFIFTRDIKDFDKIKQPVLDSIKSMGVRSFIDDNQHIHNSDWHMSNKPHKRAYMSLIEDAIDDYFKYMKEEFGYRGFINSYWFQQYEEGGFHCKHNHPGADFSNVMFFELPDKKVSTTFYIKDDPFKVDVKEGQILTFPGFLIHESPVNTSGRKTSIVFNSIMEYQ